MQITKELVHEMVKTHREVAEPQLQAIFKSQSNLKKVVIDETLMEQLVYQDIHVLGNDEMYFFFHGENLVYQGMVDSEGLLETIKNDILSTPTFLNVHILVHDGNEAKLYEFLSNTETLIKYGAEMTLAFAKGQENGHY